MGSKFIDLQRQLFPALRTGDLAACERVLVSKLAALSVSPFHIILDLSIQTEAEAAADWLDKFLQEQGARFAIGASYVEMNGFSINTDLWFCNAFAYDTYGGHDDYDWLSFWKSEDSDILPIKGLEPLQDVFASEAFRDKRFSDACDVAELLVVVKFQALMQRAAARTRALRFPLLVTAHDWDFVYEFRPGA